MLCIDASPNSFLANQIAEQGGGIAKFLTSDPSEGDISTAMDTILEDWASPVTSSVRLTVNRQGLSSASKIVVNLQNGDRFGNHLFSKRTYIFLYINKLLQYFMFHSCHKMLNDPRQPSISCLYPMPPGTAAEQAAYGAPYPAPDRIPPYRPRQRRALSLSPHSRTAGAAPPR